MLIRIMLVLQYNSSSSDAPRDDTCVVPACSPQTPSTLSTSDSRRASRNRNSDSDSNSNKQEKEKESPPASEAAKDVARRLGVAVPAAVGAGRSKRRVPVTVCVNDVRGVCPCFILAFSGVPFSVHKTVLLIVSRKS